MRPHLPRFYHNITLHYYNVFCHLMILTLANMTTKLPEDGVLTPKHIPLLLHRAFCRVIQLAHQLTHIHKKILRRNI